MKRRHKRKFKVVGWMVASVALWWIILAVARDARTAWLLTGALVFGYFLLLSFPKLYGLYCRWTYERKLARMSSEERDAESSKTLSEAKAFLHEMREKRRQQLERSRVAWYWKALDAFFGLVFVWLPPLLLSLAHHQPLSWNAEVTVYHLLAMGCGLGAYYLVRASAIELWRGRYGMGSKT